MSDKQGWKERLRGDVRLTLPEKPDIVGRYTSCERFLPEEQKPVRAWPSARSTSMHWLAQGAQQMCIRVFMEASYGRQNTPQQRPFRLSYHGMVNYARDWKNVSIRCYGSRLPVKPSL